MAIGAHPDDIETFAGGTGARYKAHGDSLFFYVATNGNVRSSTSTQWNSIDTPWRSESRSKGTRRRTDMAGLWWWIFSG